MTTTTLSPPDQLIEQIRHRLEHMQASELREIELTNLIDNTRTHKRTIELGYIADGLDGTNEKARQANLEDRLMADGAYQLALQDEASAKHELDLVRASLADHRRQLALEMEILRHMRTEPD